MLWLFLLQADSQMSKDRQVFYDASLQYVFKIQEVQERKKFEFVEPVSSHKNIILNCVLCISFGTQDFFFSISPLPPVLSCVHTDMIMERHVSQVLKNTHYTHCLASDKNVLITHISKAHFPLL